jgi:hypothetical protein
MVPGRGLLYHKLDPPTSNMSWFYLKAGASEPLSTELPTRSPVLSTDGEWIGWVEDARIFIRRPAGSRPAYEIDLRAFGLPKAYTLIQIDAQNREVLVAHGDSFKTAGFDGKMRSAIQPDNVDVQPQTFLKMRDGWIGWDAYQEDDPYRVRWSLPGGSGTHRVLKGRGIGAVAANPAGTLIAVSVTTNLNIGIFPDAVYVLRTRDGSEVFRRFLPRYSRSHVLFPSDDLFVYSSEGKTHLLQVIP